MDDEILDVVDGFDTVIDTVNRKDYNQFLSEKRGYLRAVELFVINREGRIWIPIRTANKTIAPSGYDYSCGGHVETGEDYLAALMRETKEETGIDISLERLEFIAKLKSEAIRYIRCVYLYHSDETPNYNPEDFVSAEWLKPEELIANIDAGHPTKLNLKAATAVLRQYLTGY